MERCAAMWQKIPATARFSSDGILGKHRIAASDAELQPCFVPTMALPLAQPWVPHASSSSFLSLSDKQKDGVDFHALLVGIFCLYILFFDDPSMKTQSDPTLVKINVAITTGYLISGLGMLPYFANFRLLAEFSTPCVNQRWFFEVLGYPKSSRPNMANGVAMAAVFFLVRIAVMPVYYIRMYMVYGTEAFYLVPWGGRVAWIGSSICLDIMNVMWMHKIARGCYRVMRSAQRSKAGAPQENGKTD
ncbi:hypothetical protein F7725_028608 [Dissostichus mawsoni]|uniref:TLC domain-containing protein n=1 Tax=Dissostichus mawsoni TaxID=36200 RepID=A0A7J5XGF7_DISMA|nr:hypothetical protein F7725_028608 [Dissostichus mawsoni]